MLRIADGVAPAGGQLGVPANEPETHAYRGEISFPLKRIKNVLR